jgi:hypothetical protein
MREITYESYSKMWDAQRTMFHIRNGYVWHNEQYIAHDLKNN